MKKILFTMIILASVVFNGIAQEKLKIGDVVNGRLKITNDAGLRSFFLNSLKNSGCLGKEIKVEPSPTSDRFMVYTRVTGNADKISSIGVMLVRAGNEAFIAKPVQGDEAGPGGGGSATYSCQGSPCSDCKISMTWPSGSWMPDVECICEEAEGQCNMIVSVSVNINIGF
jgi:hypothetical protein